MRKKKTVAPKKSKADRAAARDRNNVLRILKSAMGPVISDLKALIAEKKTVLRQIQKESKFRDFGLDPWIMHPGIDSPDMEKYLYQLKRYAADSEICNLEAVLGALTPRQTNDWGEKYISFDVKEAFSLSNYDSIERWDRYYKELAEWEEHKKQVESRKKSKAVKKAARKPKKKT